jgi:hypothetical protein
MSQESPSHGGSKGFSVPFCPFETGNEILPVRSGSAEFRYLKFSKLKARQRKEPGNFNAWGRQRFFSAFLLFKAGSEILPVRSGAAEPGYLKLYKLNARQRRSQPLRA